MCPKGAKEYTEVMSPKNTNRDGFIKFDTFASTIYLVKLAQDAKIYKNEPDEEGQTRGDDVVLTFCDNSRFNNTEDLWVDARVIGFQKDRAKGLRKGDQVQITGKLRFKKNDDGTYRGKIYDAIISSFVNTRGRMEETAEAEDTDLPF
jgi:hypothetical protein